MSGNLQTGQAKRKRPHPGLKLAAAALILLAVLAVFLWPRIDEARTILSLKKVDDYPLYTMTYYGDYRLDYTVDNPNLKAQNSGMMCSSFLARNEKGEPLFCRNLDYALANHPIVMVDTSARQKYAGIGICDLYYLGYSNDKLPSGSLFSDRALLSAPRITIDGMNEYGVALAMLSVPHAEPTLDPKKQSIDEGAAVRLILDQAKTVAEAVDVLKGYNMLFHEGASHFMIADGNGDSAVVEFVNGEIVVIKSDNPWQVVTNFILSGKTREGVGQNRYDLAEETLEKTNGVLSEEDAMKLLADVSQPGTLWSVIYNLKTGEARLALKMKYDKLHTFQLKMQP
jgi:hypothetical protein